MWWPWDNGELKALAKTLEAENLRLREMLRNERAAARGTQERMMLLIRALRDVNASLDSQITQQAKSDDLA